MTILRPYQAAAVAALREQVRQGRRRILLASPTGSGKGTIAADLVRSSLALGRRVLVLTHRRELVEDLAERIAKLGLVPGVLLPDVAEQRDLAVQVASVQTLARRSLPEAQLVLCDEAHHATAETYTKIFAGYPGAVIVGLTATPARLSGKPLGDLFESLVEAAKPAELVAQGHLVPVTGFAYDSPDLRRVDRRGGDYDDRALCLLMGGQRIMGNVVEQYQRHCPTARAVVFAVNVEHSQLLAGQFRAAGVAAEHVDGTAARDARGALFDRFRSGATRVLCNVQLATEGFDLPAIEAVLLCRPTLSLVLALQMIGRGRRPLPCACGQIPHWRSPACACGAPVLKHCVRVHDHAGVVAQHSLPDEPREWSLTRSVRVGKRAQGKGPGALRTCNGCFAIYAADLEACPVCQHRNQARRRLVRNADGIAVPLEAVKRRVVAPCDYLRWLTIEANRKHYKPAWIAVRFKVRFGRWPTASDRQSPPPSQQPPTGGSQCPSLTRAPTN